MTIDIPCTPAWRSVSQGLKITGRSLTSSLRDLVLLSQTDSASVATSLNRETETCPGKVNACAVSRSAGVAARHGSPAEEALPP